MITVVEEIEPLSTSKLFVFDNTGTVLMIIFRVYLSKHLEQNDLQTRCLSWCSVSCVKDTYNEDVKYFHW